MVSDDDVDVVLGELDELFVRKAERRGVGAARRWYWRQALGFLWRAPSARRHDGRGGMLEDLRSDVRWAVRGLVKRPTFAVVAVLTLALGIGANSAIFTLLDAHFFAPLPWDSPSELVLIWETRRNSEEVTTVAPGNYFTWRDETASFEDVAAFNVDYAVVSDGDGPAERLTASYVSPHFFDVLGVAPVLGSGFDEASVEVADGRVVILSHGLWRRRYGSDPGMVGSDIRVDGAPYTVVGVLPPDYRQPEQDLSWQATELWRPLLLDGQRQNFQSRWLRAVARLGPGVDVQQAQDEMDAVARRMAEAYPAQNGGRAILVRTVDEYLLGEARPTLLMLLGAGVSVFLVVCANVANLTLARGEERRREFAVRAALGSGDRRLLRQVLVEGIVLALAGAVLGTLLVWLSRDLLQAVQSRFFSGLVDASVDLRVVVATALLAVVAGVLFGLPLARTASRTELRDALAQGGERAGRGRGVGPTRNLLVVGQVGLATALVVVAALLVRSFNELVNVHPGFEARDVVTFEVTAPPDREGREGVRGYFRELQDELEAIPGVASVAMVSDMPFTLENRWTELILDDVASDPTDPPRSEYRTVTPEYFRVMGIPLVQGTLPEPSWEERRPMPVVVNRAFASLHFPGRDPLGATFRLQWQDTITATVVGVAADVLDDGYDASVEAIFYAPFGTLMNRRMAFVIRGEGMSPALMAAIRDAVVRVDPEVPTELRLVETMLAETVVRPRAASLIGALFAVLALLVAAAGIYGVLTYLVQSRTREIGVRAALGATGSQLTGMIMGQSTRLLVAGLTVGLGGALLAGRALSGLLFGVPAWDPLSMAVATVLLGSVGTLAAWLPARRAVRVDPREALRAE